MADPMRAEVVTLKDGRKVVVRPARLSDAESLLRNVNLIGREGVFILIDEVGPDLDEERQWLGTFDRVRSVLFGADADGETLGSTDCPGRALARNPLKRRKRADRQRSCRPIRPPSTPIGRPHSR